MKSIWIIFTAFLFSLLFISRGADAQETSGGIEGKVMDAKGQPLAGASVEVVHLPTGTKYATMTGVDGHYQLSDLRIGGPYTMDVTLVGKAVQYKEEVVVSLARVGRMDFTLTDKAEQLKEVVVSSGARRGHADQYGTGTNISSASIHNMPSATRSIQDMTRLVPQGNKDNSFTGTNFRYNNVTIDGAINNDAIGFSPSAGGITGSSGMPGSSTRSNPISMDAIQDIQVYLAPYDVKIGNFTGGSINAVTRSGSNVTEGSVYSTLKNSALTGPDNAGDGSKMPGGFHESQTGFRVGFPLVKNKLFFFTNEEVTRRQDVILLGAGSKNEEGIISLDSAKLISGYLLNNYGFNAGTYGNYNVYSNSEKFFNRIDWNIDEHHQLSIRNNYVSSESTNLERDQQDFRFSSIDYVQCNRQQSTALELKSNFGQLSNVLILGFTTVHDYRTPQSDPSLPQVQIVGHTPGTTIFLGTDREASIFNMRQKTMEITDNLTYRKGKNTFLFGTHNELYSIDYGFVNSWNGRVDYFSVRDFLNNNPARVRGSYDYSNNDRDYILAHGSSHFHVGLYSAYLQDEIRVNDRVKLTPGIRADMTMVPRKQELSPKTQNALTDPSFGNTYTYTPLNQITNDYLGWKSIQFSPRVGINWDIRGDQSLVLRGGTGLFTGRIPFAWMGYSFYNNGETFGAYDQRAINAPFGPGTDPLKPSQNGIADFAAANGAIVGDKYAGATQVDVIDNHFRMPQVWRSSLALDFKNGDWNFTVEAIYTKTLYDVKFQQVNLHDDPRYFSYDTISRLQPVFVSGNTDPAFANAHELSNTTLGYRYSLTAKVARRIAQGFQLSVAYTYGQSKDITNGIRNSMESNWQLTQALNPNNPGLAWSNFDIRHRIIASMDYRRDWSRQWGSSFSLFVSLQSGSPFTYGFVNFSIQRTPQQVSLAYIPGRNETALFFQDIYDELGQVIQSSRQQAETFNHFIDADKYLSSRRGNWTQRNAARTPWNNQADLRFTQDFHFGIRGHRQTISFTYDILNVTNLLDKNWGHVYFSPNTFNSTSSVGLVQVLDPSQKPLVINGGYPAYKFSDPGRPYSVDFFASRWQMQMGLRYSF